jgi:hypothetical protein
MVNNQGIRVRLDLKSHVHDETVLVEGSVTKLL